MLVQGSQNYYQPRLTAMRATAPVSAGGDLPVTVQSGVQMAPLSNSMLGMSRLIGNEMDLARLSRWGIASEGMLRFAAGGSIRRAIASFLTGIPEQKILMYGQMADMLRVRGMDPDAAHLLVMAGCRTPMELSRYAGENVVAEVQRGIVWAGMAAQAANSVLSDSRTYQVPSLDQLKLLANASVGVGSTINYGAVPPTPTSPGLLT